MSKQKKTIVNKLHESIVTPEELKKNTDELIRTAEDSLGIDEPEAKEYVAGFMSEDDQVVGRGIGAGMNPEIEADKYEEYKALMSQLSAEESGDGVSDEVTLDKISIDEEGNDPVKLKNDVIKLMAKLDMSSIEPYLTKIDNPVEQAEVIGQFAEKIGVPRAKLSMVIAQLKDVAESDEVKMTKDKLVEAVTGRKIIRTIKVKDIK